MPSFSARQTHPTKRRVAFVLFERTKLIDVAGPLQVFSDARLPDGGHAYQVTLVSEAGGPIETDTGVVLQTDTFEACRAHAPDTVIVSGGDSAIEAARSARLLSLIDEVAGRCRRLGSVCVGAFILATAGYLNGRRAVTHWEHCAELQRLFPETKVREDSIFEEDGGIWTSAGVTAGIDMALAMVEHDLGRAESMRLAQSFVLYMKRAGGQRQFSSVLATQVRSGSGEFDALLAGIMKDLSSDLSVPRLAAMAHMSERNFSRRFSAAMGCSPARFVDELRVDAACEAIQRGEARLSDLPRLFGFASPERMRRAFQRTKGVAPSDYQARFGGSPR